MDSGLHASSVVHNKGGKRRLRSDVEARNARLRHRGGGRNEVKMKASGDFVRDLNY